MSVIKAVGIDLAKLVFSIHVIDEHDKYRFHKTFKRLFIKHHPIYWIFNSGKYFTDVLGCGHNSQQTK